MTDSSNWQRGLSDTDRGRIERDVKVTVMSKWPKVTEVLASKVQGRCLLWYLIHIWKVTLLYITTVFGRVFEKPIFVAAWFFKVVYLVEEHFLKIPVLKEGNENFTCIPFCRNEWMNSTFPTSSNTRVHKKPVETSKAH